MSNLHDHAKRELELLGEEPKVIDWYLRVIDTFRSFGHSGGSASVTIPILNDLLQWKNLTPLTSNPDEWIDHSQFTGEPMWQNVRNPAVFSNDGGKTYWNLDQGKDIIHRSHHNEHA